MMTKDELIEEAKKLWTAPLQTLIAPDEEIEVVDVAVEGTTVSGTLLIPLRPAPFFVKRIELPHCELKDG